MHIKSILTLIVALGLCAGTANAKGKGHVLKRDVNGDGVLSMAEFMAHRKHPKRAKARFEKADANHDGQLTQPERIAFRKHKVKKHGLKKDAAKKPGLKKHGEKKDRAKKHKDGE